MPALFVATLFVSAALLFLVQPMIAKMVLPQLGGSPAVWNTCMVFFQATLLAGYATAHGLSARLSVRIQMLLLAILLLLPFVVLPIRSDHSALASAPGAENPIPWLLEHLVFAVGLPFLALSTLGPLLQRWFSRTDHPAARDPYALYAASNLGSMLALLSYPIVVEPLLPLASQSRVWAGGYLLLVVLTLTCGFVASLRPATVLPASNESEAGDDRPISTRRRLSWVLLAFVPSSLMLGVTTYLSTDIAAIPLLWVIPLAIYLLSFIFVFARRQAIPHRTTARVLPILALVLAVLLLCEDMQPPIFVAIFLHLLALFIAALFCHGELARDRPSPRALTEFYLWMAVGGVLGGLFNALLAPLIFTRVVEYPLVLVLACVLRYRVRPGEEMRNARSLGWAAVLGGAGAVAGLGALTASLVLGLQAYGPESPQLRVGLMFGVPVVLCYTLVDRPLRFALGLGAIFAASSFYTGAEGRPIYAERSFFGVHRVTLDRTGTFHQMVHGNTVHGRQRFAPGELSAVAGSVVGLIAPPGGSAAFSTVPAVRTGTEQQREPLSYYSRQGPVGSLFRALSPRLSDANIGVIGLGAGSIAAYAEPRQSWTYYEIDPVVRHIASKPRYFTFLSDAAAPVRVILGDGRLRLRDAPDGHYRLLVLDAFSSDAIPIHLLTREALQLYIQKLEKGGVLLFHLSNRYLDLKPVVASLAGDADLVSRFYDDLKPTRGDRARGIEPSQWAILARTPDHLGKLSRSAAWQPYPTEAALPSVWTDDYSNVLGLFKSE